MRARSPKLASEAVVLESGTDDVADVTVPLHTYEALFGLVLVCVMVLPSNVAIQLHAHSLSTLLGSCLEAWVTVWGLLIPVASPNMIDVGTFTRLLSKILSSTQCQLSTAKMLFSSIGTLDFVLISRLNESYESRYPRGLSFGREISDAEPVYVTTYVIAFADAAKTAAASVASRIFFITQRACRQSLRSGEFLNPRMLPFGG